MFCELTTGKEWHSSISSWFRTFFLTSPWNWSSPLKLWSTKTHRQHKCFMCVQRVYPSARIATLTAQQKRGVWRCPWSSWTLYKESPGPHRMDDWENKKQCWKTLSTKSGKCLIQRSFNKSHFSCVVKISKKPLVSMRSSILTKGIDTLEKQNSD